MAAFTLSRSSGVAAALLWEVVTDVSRHGDYVPLTSMRADPGEPRLGWGFAGVTGLGPLAFSDQMVITLWEPPVGGRAGRARFVKVGRLVRGWAEIAVSPAPDGSVVTWTEELGPPPASLARLLSPVSTRVGRALFGRVLDGLVAEAEAIAAGAADD